ncbi:rhodanese-like domain-containing protein [Nonomuraea aurantiaca]|uniref:rhodanese-like domain-containing protein n=1 Tax=Nonomuraea aurantiaca TaxID=2878562 RepID=UPI001CDA35A7|nr:rhodanese-like domain-containing protein [Nonomuraea aurantiaca]MCA2227426.1 rhodanese-like domain-containing protein [Nonomuraea aurantiaca]
MTITRDELRASLGTVTVLDTLGGAYYDQQHLPGAIALVESEVAERAPALLPDKDAPIVTYCSNPACNNSKAVARHLTALGYTNVRRYVEGIEDWVTAGLPVESS